MAFTLDHTNAILDLLQSNLTQQVGDAEALENPAYPYCVLYAFDVFDFHMSGPFSDAQGDKQLMYHVVNVGRNRLQCESMAEEVRSVMLSNQLTVPGYVVQQINLDLLGRAVRDTDIRPEVYVITDRYRIFSTPS